MFRKLTKDSAQLLSHKLWKKETHEFSLTSVITFCLAALSNLYIKKWSSRVIDLAIFKKQKLDLSDKEVACFFRAGNWKGEICRNGDLEMCIASINPFSPVQFSTSIVSDSLWPHGLQHTRLPSPSPTPKAYSNSCPSSQWCHPNISSHSPPTFNLSQHQGLFQWVSSSHLVAKVLEFQLQHQSFQ